MQQPTRRGAGEPPSLLSLLSPIGYQSSDCGYCRGHESSQRTPDSRASYYARSDSLSPVHYQYLMDRGWRRSGSLLYLPDPSRSCCPHYTIRLPVAEFKPTRDQRQALHRWNRHILGEDYLHAVAAKYPKSKEEKKRRGAAFDLLSTVHESETQNVKPDITPKHRLEVSLETDDFTEEKFALFDNYQRHVHHEDDDQISRRGFTRFLCSSPLHRSGGAGGGSQELGSFHQCYRLDGRLVAMAVLDLLPHAVSGVYFIYHRDVEQWSLGKLSALREAALTVEGGYTYYYMGYYIHSCKKMRYKADFRPQHVLDCDSLQWDPLDDTMRRLMDRRRWVSMSRERRLEAADNDNDNDNDDVDDDAVKAAKIYQASFPEPLDAYQSRRSLLSLGMPGVLTLEQLHAAALDLDTMRVTLGLDVLYRMRDIVSWNSGQETEPNTIKGVIAEFAAAVGPTIAREIVVHLGQ